MDGAHAVSPWIAAGAMFAIMLSASFYAQWLRRISARGGKVNVAEFGIPDLFVGSFLLVFFLAAIARGFGGKPRPATTADLIGGAVTLGLLIVFLLAFLRWRGIRLTALFGVLRVAWWKVLPLSGAFFLAAMPLALAASALVKMAGQSPLERQPLVDFFSDAARDGDAHAAILTVVMGAIVAPITEELLFRGYIYGVLKRYARWPAALVLTSLLFAAIHLNAASLPSLFVLAVALTLAYEITGSILVNITMHAMFNATMLAALWAQAHKPL